MSSHVSGCVVRLCAFLFAWASALTAAPAAEGLIASPEPGWPQWRGPRRDAISNETGLLRSWPEGGPQLLWKVDGLGTGWSSPIVVNGTLYVTGDTQDDLTIHAFDLDGKPKWRTANGAAWKGQWPGARACCVYSEGALYHLNAHGRVAAIDATTGKERWSVDLFERFGAQNITWAMSECLLVDGPRLIVTPGGPNTLMAALDKTTGETVWMSEPLEGEPAAYSSPILFGWGGQRILANFSAGHVFGVDADSGRLLWSAPFRNRFGSTVATLVYGDGRLFCASPDGPDGIQFRIGSGGAMTVERVWTSTVDTLTGSGILIGGRLFATGCKKIKTLHCIDWDTGASLYELPKQTTGTVNYASSAMVWADERLYCLFESGGVALLNPGADGFETAGRFQLLATPRKRDVWAHPVLLDGRLYLRYHDTLWCYDVRRPEGH